MHRAILLLTAALTAGCAAGPAHAPLEEQGLPLVVPAAPETPSRAPDPPPAPLSAEACSALHLVLPETHGVIAHEAYARAFAGMDRTLRDAVCACPPRTDRSSIVVKTTPDLGDVSAHGATPDAPIDACLAARLQNASLPRWHLGTDCIDCGPRRYGIFPGSPPVDAAPRDGIATLIFHVGVVR